MWRERLVAVCAIEDVEFKRYLERIGFVETMMKPNYSGEKSKAHLLQTKGEPCMQLNTRDRKTKNELIIFVNDAEMYMEEIGEQGLVRTNHLELTQGGLGKKNWDDNMNRLLGLS